jgi:hypothetical protein
MATPAVYDHVAPVGDDVPDGRYRVVGTDDETVTLLRVADADGRRTATGETVRVTRETFARFEAAPNPDGDRPPGDAVRSAVEAGYWSLRAIGRELIGRPLPTAVALAFVLVGLAGDGAVALPPVVDGGLILAGSLGLAYLASGRGTGHDVD